MLDYKITNISLSDINVIKKTYMLGNENKGNDPNNPYNERSDMSDYNRNLVNGKTFFCDTNNTELIEVIKKNIEIDDKHYISNIHYINYGVGHKAKKHDDLSSAVRTYIILLSDNFKGGEFRIEDQLVEFKIGDILEFDSALKHEVNLITEGSREVLVIWMSWNKKKDKSLL